MVFDNWSGKHYLMGIARRLYLLGVISGLILAGLFYLAIRFLF